MGKKKNEIIYSNIPSTLKLVPHDDNMTVSPDTYTLNLETTLEEASSDASAHMQEDQDFTLFSSSERKKTYLNIQNLLQKNTL